MKPPGSALRRGLVPSRLAFMHDADGLNDATTGDRKGRPSHGTSDVGSVATDGGCSKKGRRGWAAGGAVAERQRGGGPAMGRYRGTLT